MSLPALILLTAGLAWAQPQPQPGEGAPGGGEPPPSDGGPPGGGPGGPGGATESGGMLGISVIFPPSAGTVRMAAQRADRNEPVSFTNDGSIVLDRPGDGEWWALLAPRPGGTDVIISGLVDGERLWHEESVVVPQAWATTTFPLTLSAERDGDGWKLSRTMSAVLPKPAKPTGAGLSSQAQDAGIPAPILYLGFGVLALVLGVTATLRSAILAARRRR